MIHINSVRSAHKGDNRLALYQTQQQQQQCMAHTLYATVLFLKG